MCDREVPVVAPPLLLQNIPWLEASADDPATQEIVRDAAGNVAIHIDACLVEAVRALWATGVVTLSSCCGHAGPDEQHPWGVITVQTKPGVAQGGAQLLGRARYEALVQAERALAEERSHADALADALGSIDRKLDVARLGLDRNGPQHARIAEARGMARVALAEHEARRRSAVGEGSEGMSVLDCAVCGHPVPVEEVDELQCFGCNALVCYRHPVGPVGGHDPQAHISDEDDGE